MKERIRIMATQLASLEIWLVALGVAGSMLAPRTLPWVLGVAGVFWVVRWLATGHISVRTPEDWAIILLVLMLPITLWVSSVPETTRPQVYRLLSGVAIYYAIANWATSRAQLRLILDGTLLLGLFLALSAPFSIVWRPTATLRFIPRALYTQLLTLVNSTRLDGTNPNVRAASLSILLPCALGILLFNWRQLGGITRAVHVITVLSMAGMLLLTQSRGGLMAFVAALLVLLSLRWRRGWILLPVSAIAAVLAVRFLGVDVFLASSQQNPTVAGLQDRLVIWSQALYLIKNFPLTGIGMGSFAQVALVMVPFTVTNPALVPIHAHNLFLQIALDLGIPGLIAWLAILMLAITGAWQIYRQGRVQGDAWVAGLGAGVMCSQVALVVHGLVDAPTWVINRPSVLVWVLWGLAIVGWQILARPANRPRAAPPSDAEVVPDVLVAPVSAGHRSDRRPAPRMFRPRYSGS